jgi:hypothetical protein
LILQSSREGKPLGELSCTLLASFDAAQPPLL